MPYPPAPQREKRAVIAELTSLPLTLRQSARHGLLTVGDLLIDDIEFHELIYMPATRVKWH